MSDVKPPDDEPVPKLPRKFSFKLPQRQLVSIFALVVALVASIALRGACATGAGRLIESFDEPTGGGSRRVLMENAPEYTPPPTEKLPTPVPDAATRTADGDAGRMPEK